jgi:glycosyltransferase involved in cell wall biosynthesis
MLDKAENPIEKKYRKAKYLFEARRFLEARKALSGFSHSFTAECKEKIYGRLPDLPRFSIIVVSHIDNSKVLQALCRIQEQVTGQDEVLLVNNGNDRLESQAANTLSDFKIILLPFPAGASAGRNVGAAFARGSYLIFLDDDGWIEPGCLDAFRRAIDETGAKVIRGKVQTFDRRDSSGPPHYNLGNVRRPSMLNCEGIACVERHSFMAFDGFDPLLYGHEGVELCGRMWPTLGSSNFIYEPDAVLLHDFTKSSEHEKAKNHRHKLCRDYVSACSPLAFRSYYNLRDIENFSPTERFSRLLTSSALAKSEGTATVITTAKNASAFMGDYVRSWKLQTHKDFQVVFVDDGSEDDTVEKLKRLWGDDGGLTIIETDGVGRSAALNIAVNAAQNEMCLIADADDISVPHRVQRTVNYLREHGSCGVVSFATFDDRQLVRQPGRPRSITHFDLKTRLLCGMAGQFPAYAFRRSLMSEKFDEKLLAGVDYDWITRNFVENPNLQGSVLYEPLVYYRTHSSQISNTRKEHQLASRSNSLLRMYKLLLDEPSSRDLIFIKSLDEGRPVEGATTEELIGWAQHLMFKNEQRMVFERFSLASVVLEHCFFAEGTAVGRVGGSMVAPVAQRLRDEILHSRRNAARLAAQGQYQMARKILRGVKQGSALRGINMQILAYARYPIVRQVFSLWGKYKDLN